MDLYFCLFFSQKMQVFSTPTRFHLLMRPLTPMVTMIVTVHSCLCTSESCYQKWQFHKHSEFQRQTLFRGYHPGVFISPPAKITCSFVDPDSIHKLMSRVGRGIILVSGRLTSSETEAFVFFSQCLPRCRGRYLSCKEMINRFDSVHTSCGTL